LTHSIIGLTERLENIAAPVAAKITHGQTVHGITLSDPYHWMRADNWQQVLREPAALPPPIKHLIESENDYAEAALAGSAALQQSLMAEMKARMEPEEAGVPVPDGAFTYYSKFREDGQHPLFCRQPRDGGAEHILLDGDSLAAGLAFFDIGNAEHSPDHNYMWWTADTQGSEFFTLRVRDLVSESDTSDILLDTDGHAVWGADGKRLYYVKMDKNHRPTSVWQHIVGQSQSADRVVYEEADPAWFVSIHTSLDGRFCIISVKDHNSSECHLLDLHNTSALELPAARLISKRKAGIRYSVATHGDRIFCLTNADGAEDFKIVEGMTGDGDWLEIVPHRAGCLIVNISVFKHFMVRLERENSLPRIVVRELANGHEHIIAFEEEAYALGLNDLLEFESPWMRFSYSSMTTPTETYDYNMQDRLRVLRKQQTVPSGHLPSDYVTRRIFATAHDGAQVPITLLYKAGLTLPAPVLLYGYGAYGHSIPAAFSTNRLSLVDRGFIFAIAHVRGGMDKGFNWYSAGKLEHKTNTFKDFISSTEHLIEHGFTTGGKIVAQGGSAGGMLMGAIANMAPELFGGIIADVPFVDVMNTMLDASLPLTPPEWLEWGNPIEDAIAFKRMLAYSPYDNVTAQAYPPILALAGLTDPRVTYWEPLKWVAKLRATMTGGGPVLLKTNMDAGHGGAAGRFDQLEEVALCQAFALICCGRSGA